MCPASELVDGYEPHDQFYLSRTPCTAGWYTARSMLESGGVPGEVQAGWVPGGVLYRYHPPIDPEAGLTLIYQIFKINRFILPFDWVLCLIY